MTRTLLLVVLFVQVAARADVAVLTQHNDLGRTGANLRETILNVNNVNTNAFGLLYTRPVDDQIYAQPLVMTNVNIPGKGAHNLLIVASVNDSVYAFDADDPTVTNAYWQVSFLTDTNIVAPNVYDIANSPCGVTYGNYNSGFGIVGTPVIDPVAGTLFLVVRTKENDINFVQRLHALDITTGAERANSPVVITATVPGLGDATVNGLISFDPFMENQRAGLALVNGVIYICWTSQCDWDPYHGWIMGYNATNLQQTCVYNDTPNGSEGGIWMSGQAPAADASGNIYVSTGNGTVGSLTDPTDTTNRSESFLKLTPGGGQLRITSWFTPYNWADLNYYDLDLGASGILLIPGTSLAFSGGKEGSLYLVNRDNMGGLSSIAADTNIVQSWSVAGTGEKLYGSAIWWNGPNGSYVYFWPGTDYLRQYKFDWTNGVFLQPQYALSPTPGPSGRPGGILSLSANGTNGGSGIVWASHTLSGDAQNATQPGILHAYNAQNVSQELWNSEQLSSRDSVGAFAKFCPPTIANGKVYLATFSNRVNVYGLLPRPALSVLKSGGNLFLSWPTNGFSGFKLQTNTSLTSGNWSNDNHTVITTNGAYRVTVPAGVTSTFYRLKR